MTSLITSVITGLSIAASAITGLSITTGTVGHVTDKISASSTYACTFEFTANDPSRLETYAVEIINSSSVSVCSQIHRASVRGCRITFSYYAPGTHDTDAIYNPESLPYLEVLNYPFVEIK